MFGALLNLGGPDLIIIGMMLAMLLAPAGVGLIIFLLVRRPDRGSKPPPLPHRDAPASEPHRKE